MNPKSFQKFFIALIIFIILMVIVAVSNKNKAYQSGSSYQNATLAFHLPHSKKVLF